MSPFQKRPRRQHRPTRRIVDNLVSSARVHKNWVHCCLLSPPLLWLPPVMPCSCTLQPCRQHESERRRLRAWRRPRSSCACLAAATRARARGRAQLSMRRQGRQHKPASSRRHTARIRTIASSSSTAQAGKNQAANGRARALAIKCMGHGSADSPGCQVTCGA